MKTRAIPFGIALLAASAVTSRAQDCHVRCGPYEAGGIGTHARLATAPSIWVDYAGSPPAWWDATWLDHLGQAMNAFAAAGMWLSFIPGGSQHIEIILVGNQQFWPEGTSTTALAATELFTGNGYVNEKKIWVNLFYWLDGNWNEESLGGPVYPQHDLATVLVHEIGHAFGLGHIIDGLEYCSVMTEHTAATEVARSLHAFDSNAIMCYYPTVAVGDIQSFGVQSSGHNANLTFTIQGGANPNEYAAVYVSDNEAGPVRLIDVLTAHANLLPGTNNWVDSYRLPPAGSYFYWLDYNPSPPANLLRTPVGLYPGGAASVSGTGGVAIDPPDILSVSDVPFDLGDEVTITWQPSLNEATIDYYNVYRKSYPPGQPQAGEWTYLLSKAPGVTSYIDDMRTVGWTNEYKISAAHHGNYTLQAGQGNTGIWNAMSTPISGVAVHNFWSDQITLLSNDTLRVCPAGDDGTLQAEVIIWSSNITPTVGIPPNLIECLPQNVGYFCDGEPLIMDAATNANGRTTMTATSFGGRDKVDLVFKVADNPNHVPFFLDTLSVYLSSPDENGDGIVDVADFAAFGGSYTSPPKEYKWYRDYAAPYGTITLPDFAHFGEHNTHSCSGGSLLAEAEPATSNAFVRVSFVETTSADDNRIVRAEVTVEDLPPFRAILMNLRSDNPSLEFRSWEPGEYEGRVLATPVVRGGTREIAIGVLDGENLSGGVASLGSIVYSNRSGGTFTPTQRDLEPLTAEILSASGDILRVRKSKSEGERLLERMFENDLGQNRPNPFNPTTTLSYSLAADGPVELRVFSVDGRVVRTLVNESQDANRYDVVWDGTDDTGVRVASGVYFYQLKTPVFSSTKKMVLLK